MVASLPVYLTFSPVDGPEDAVRWSEWSTVFEAMLEAMQVEKELDKKGKFRYFNHQEKRDRKATALQKRNAWYAAKEPKSLHLKDNNDPNESQGSNSKEKEEEVDRNRDECRGAEID